MEKINIINKKKVITCITIFLIFIISIIFIVCIFREEDGINGVVLYSNTKLYSKPLEDEKKIKKEIKKNTDVKILDTVLENGKEWYKVRIDRNKGYILSKDIDYFQKDKSNIVLVADFSSHNFKDVFETKNDVEAFLLKYNVSYVYIRAGGRGYGKEGNFYTDDKYKEFKKACEYIGIQYGYYFLDEALTNAEITSEVEYIDNFMRKNISKLCTLPVVIDVEEHEGKGRCDEIWEQRAQLVSKLLKNLNNVGYKTILYSNANTCNKYLSTIDTKFWLAYYPNQNYIPNYWYSETNQPATENSELLNKMVGWQFSEAGVDNVIEENIDLSIFKSDF